MGIVKFSPRSAALMRAVYGERAAWSDLEHLMATVVDMLRILAWQNTEDARRGKNAPKPMTRPGVQAAVQGQSFGGKGVPVDQFKQRWAEAQARAAAEIAAQSQTEQEVSDGV